MSDVSICGPSTSLRALKAAISSYSQVLMVGVGSEDGHWVSPMDPGLGITCVASSSSASSILAVCLSGLWQELRDTDISCP